MEARRDELYFEPRCIDLFGRVRWYGELLEHPALFKHGLGTVYIRDSGETAYVYGMVEDEKCWREDLEEIKTTMRLICKVQKERKQFIYGRKIPGLRR